MAVTADQLLVNVSVNTEKAAASLDALADELKALRGEFTKTGASTEKASKSVTDFGTANLKIMGVLNNVEKSAKLVGKALKFAFGDDFIKEATEQFERLGAEVGSAINEGLQMDVGKELISTLKDITKSFKDMKPIIVDTISTIKNFVGAVKDGLAALNWEALVVTLSLIASSLALAFGPAIISAVSAFAASMTAAAIPVAIIAVKVVVIGVALAALAATIEIAVRNFDTFKSIISEGLLIAFAKAKQAMADFGMTAIVLITKIVAKAGEMFPAFAGTAAKAVNALTETLVELGHTSTEAAKEAEALGLSLSKSASGIDFGVTGQVIDGLKKGWDAFGNSIENSSKAQTDLKFAVRGTAKEIEEAKKLAEEFKKTQEELGKFLTEQQKSSASLGATEVANIQAKATADRVALGVLVEKLTVQGKINKAIMEQIAASAQAIASNEQAAIDKVHLDSLKQILQQNQDLGVTISAQTATTRERIALELSAAQQIIDKKIELLKLDKVIDENSIAALEEQKKLLGDIAASKSAKAPGNEFESAAGVGTDIASSISGAFTSGALGAAAGMMSGVGAIADVAQGIIDFIPTILNKIANIFSTLADLPIKILEGFQNIFGAVLKFVANFIPNIIKMIGGLLEAAVSFIETLPDVLIGMLDTIPDMILGLISKLPDLAIRLINALIGAMPKLITQSINFLVKDAPRIIFSLMKTLYSELPKAILKALISALKSAASALGNLFKGGMPKVKLDTAQITKGVKALGRTLSGEASKLFSVMDLGEGSKATDKAKELTEGIENGMKKAGNWLKEIWDKIVKALKAVWMLIYDTVIKPFLDVLKAVWMFVWDTVIKPLIEGLKIVWKFIYDSVIKPFIEILKSVWSAVTENMKAAWNGIVSVLQAVWSSFINTLKAVWDGVVSIFKNLWNSVKAIWDTMMDLFSGKISFMDAVGKIWGTILETARVAWEAVSKVFGTMFDGAKNVFNKVIEAFSGVFNSFTEGAAKIGSSIWDSVKKGFEGAGKMFEGLGASIWESLKKGLAGIGDIIKNALDAISPNNIMKKVFGGGMGEKGTVENALKIDIPYVKFAAGGIVPGKAMVPGNSELNDRIVALLSPGEAVIPRDKMANPAIRELIDMIMGGTLKPPGFAFGVKDLQKGASKVGAGLSSGAKGVVGGVVSGVKEIGSAASDAYKGSGISDALGKLDPTKAWARVLKELENMVMNGLQSFHSGGMVRGYAFGGEVPAMLQAGEFVMNRGAVSSLGEPFMRSVNSGSVPSGTGTTNIEMNFDIKTTQPIDEAFFRNSLMPKVRDELRRASLDGAFIVSGSGVRKT